MYYLTPSAEDGIALYLSHILRTCQPRTSIMVPTGALHEYYPRREPWAIHTSRCKAQPPITSNNLGPATAPRPSLTRLNALENALIMRYPRLMFFSPRSALWDPLMHSPLRAAEGPRRTLRGGLWPGLVFSPPHSTTEFMIPPEGDPARPCLHVRPSFDRKGREQR